MVNRECCFPPAEYDPHVFDTILELTGDEPSTVYCQKGRYCRDFAQDDVTTMLINLRGGPFLEFNCHWVLDPDWNSGSTQSFDIICKRGRIRHKWFGLEWHTKDGKGEFASSRNAVDGVRTQGNRWQHYEALIDGIENGTKLSPDEHDGLRYVRIQDAALRSAEAGTPIHLD
jgi:predicted dehydrogenase